MFALAQLAPANGSGRNTHQQRARPTSGRLVRFEQGRNSRLGFTVSRLVTARPGPTRQVAGQGTEGLPRPLYKLVRAYASAGRRSRVSHVEETECLVGEQSGPGVPVGRAP